VNLEDVLSRLGTLTAEQKDQLTKDVLVATGTRKFIPSPGPQTDAYFSKADVLLYGGSAGGGKSSLLAGLAIEDHRRSLIVRRQVGDLDPIIDEVLKFHGSRDGFNGSVPQKLRFGDNRQITFGGLAAKDDWQKFQGNARDFLGVDEAAQFMESQIRMLMAWVRSATEGQRTRTVLASNPPIESQGDYLIGMFRPWLDLTHHNPAEHGELRWFVTDPDGKDMEVDGPEWHQFPGQAEPSIPKSRTFIPAALRDNPYLTHDSQYRAELDSLPEPMRSALRDGNFMLARQDNAWQTIPTQWIREAQARWTDAPPAHAPMSCLAVDIAQGGADTTTFSARYDGWFAPLEQVPGADTPTGNEVAGLAIAKRRNGCALVLDMGGGYGGAAMMRLKDNDVPVIGHKGAEASVKRSLDAQFGFFNKRSEIYWRLREALDPSQDGGSPIALPDDPELVSDLTAPTYAITSRGVQVEPKDKVIAKLGRSPDKGDAVAMANAYGPKLMTHGNQWRKFSDQTRSHAAPKVVMSRMAARR
jgi:hypothetical protein